MQLMWSENYVCSLLANNVVSFAVNVVLSARIFSINLVTKWRCFHFLAQMFAVTVMDATGSGISYGTLELFV